MDNNLAALTVIFTEFYYWITVVLMFLIHVGFCMYEVSVSRHKNHMHTLLKNSMLAPLVTVTFFFFGWWIYFALPNGPGILGLFKDVESSGLIAAPFATPWSELMGTHLGGKPASAALTAADTALWARLNGVFWAAFLLFSWTAASIISGAIIERVRSFAFWIIAVMIGSVTWVIDAAWGWHPNGWMVQVLGYHDAYASGVIHAIAGGTALGVLVHLGPRIGRFDASGKARAFPLQNHWLTVIGLFLIYTGFWGFYAACNVPIFDVDSSAEGVWFSATNIYLQPTTLSAITFNFLMSLSGGMLAGYILSKGEGFWTFSAGLAGVIAGSAGNDLYHPLQALVVGALGATVAYKLHYWVENRFKIDDAVGAVAVHGYGGFFGVVIAGFLLWGYPASPLYDSVVTPWGQLIGAVIMFWVLGFLPAWVVAGLMKRWGVLRIPEAVELAGLDRAEHLDAAIGERELVKVEEQAARGAGLV